LKEAILAALDKVGGVDYLARLAVENSSAFSSLLGKVLPSTLAVDDASKGQLKVTFERVIVHPNGHREIEGVTPKLLEQQAPNPIELEVATQSERAYEDHINRQSTEHAPESTGGLSSSNKAMFKRDLMDDLRAASSHMLPKDGGEQLDPSDINDLDE
jgi:hypothetical protein